MSTADTPADPQQLRAEIERTRADLGETVQELAAKADVKARAKQAVGDATDRARQKLSGVKDQAAQAAGAAAEKASTRRPLPLATIAAAVAAVVALVVVARRRRS
jgi:ElaB/YqjD/DUF883 family membrane-anchored ribosome-binding protein